MTHNILTQWKSLFLNFYHINTLKYFKICYQYTHNSKLWLAIVYWFILYYKLDNANRCLILQFIPWIGKTQFITTKLQETFIHMSKQHASYIYNASTRKKSSMEMFTNLFNVKCQALCMLPDGQKLLYVCILNIYMPVSY